MKSGVRKIFFDENFFENIDSEKKAYWLGFIYADGSVYDGNQSNTQTSLRLSINLQREDKRHLEKFAEDLMFTGEIKDFISVSPMTVNPSNQSKIVLNSNSFCRNLIKNGVTQNKTYTMEVPKYLEKEFFYHFLRGYIDGDGSYFFNKRYEYKSYRFQIEIVSHCSNILEYIKSMCEKDNIKPNISFRKEVGAYRLFFTGKNNVGKLIELMYKNSTVYLDRKYTKAQQLLQIATLGRNAYRLEGDIGEIFQFSRDNAEITREIKNSLTS